MKELLDSVKFTACFIGLSYLAGIFFTRGAMHAVGL